MLMGGVGVFISAYKQSPGVRPRHRAVPYGVPACARTRAWTAWTSSCRHAHHMQLGLLALLSDRWTGHVHVVPSGEVGRCASSSAERNQH